MNIFLLMIPKKEVAILDETMNARQALEKMRTYHYTAIPVISKEGLYLGTITEGDLLYGLLSLDKPELEQLAKHNVTELIRKDFTPAVNVDEDMDVLLCHIMNANYVPIIDDRGVLMGIITRRSVISHLLEEE